MPPALKPNEFFEFSQDLVKHSERVIKEHYLDPRLQVDQKSDRSLVTRADREAESVLRETILKAYPSHGIIGEEWGNENESAEFVWTLDPIDGTFSFVSGVPLFGTLIGLLYQGAPVLGVIHQPILDQLCIGSYEGTYLNGRRIRITEKPLAEATLLTTDFTNIPKFQPESNIEQLCQAVYARRTWGDCYGYLLVASGLAQIMLDPIMNPWDSAPLTPIIEGAGGILTDWHGNNRHGITTSTVVATPQLHPLVLEFLRG